ncbi:MAG: prepilin-type N-terminal cleavage/methylation domain-containing protein [Deferrisomatales bacterium]|nr:prepilin-type N-terminal cleavage/methylation domain-containing protein [Deferrisomatales bacterium]
MPSPILSPKDEAHAMCRYKGFSLVELMVVVAILGILAAVAIPQYLNYIKAAKANALQTNCATTAGLIRNEIAKRNAGGQPFLDTPAQFVAELNRGDKRSPYDPAFAAFAVAGSDPGTVVITKNIAVTPNTYGVVAYDASGNALAGSNISIVLE